MGLAYAKAERLVPPAMNAFTELLDGYRRFRSEDYDKERARWSELAEGQSPKVMIIACCDSRVDPATVFDIDPGQAFILRNVANLVPPFEPGGGLHGVSSAIEFAVTGLKVDHVVIMGHASCGGVAAALSGLDKAEEHSFVGDWIGLIEEPRDRIRDDDSIEDKQLALEQAGVVHSIENLRTFPYVAEAEKHGRLTIRGCHFGIRHGQLTVLNPDSGAFEEA